MANKYCNLVPGNKIKNEYTKITNGFTAVEADIKANDAAAQAGIVANTAALTAHKNTDAAVHPAEKITYSGLAGGTNVKAALNSLKTDMNNIAAGGTEHDAFVTAAMVDAEGTDYGAAGEGTYLDGRLTAWEQRQMSHLADVANIKEFGAIGDDTADDITSFNNWIISGKKILMLERNKVYKVTNSIFVPDNVTMFFNGAKIKMYLDGKKPAFVVGSNNNLYDIDIEVYGTGSDGFVESGHYQTPLTIGNVMDETVFVHDVNIHNVKLWGNRSGGKLMGISGNIKNIKIDNVVLPDNDFCIVPIVIHWGNTDDYSNTGSVHPSNIKITNIVGGKFTKLAVESCGIFISAGYNIEIENINFESLAGDGITVYSGDVGFQWANEVDKRNAMKNIKIKNASCKVGRKAYKVVGAGGTITTEVYDPSIVFENITSTSIDKTVATSAGLYFENTLKGGVEIINADISQHYFGIAFGANAKSIKFKNCKVYDNYTTGAYVDFAGTEDQYPTDITFEGGHYYSNGVGTTGSYLSGIYVNKAKRTNLINVAYGDRINELYQFCGLRLTGSAKNTKIINNHVYNVIAGGGGYILGISTDSGIVDSFYNNTVGEGITLKAGSTDIPLLIKEDGSKLKVPNKAKGTAKFSGDGTKTTFTIPHELGATPIFYSAIPINDATGSIGIKMVGADATNIGITFKTPPPVGTENMSVNWIAEL